MLKFGYPDPDRWPMDNHKLSLKEILIFILIAISAFVVYYDGLNNALMFDDQYYLAGDYSLHFSKASDFLTRTDSQHFIPLYNVLNVQLFRFFSGNVFILHFFNFALLSYQAFLIFIIISLITRERPLAFVTGLLFLFHPVNLEEITWITNNCALLSSVLVSLAFIRFHHFATKNDKASHFYALFFFSLALLAFEFQLVFPIIIWAYLYFIRGESFVLSVKRSAGFLIIGLLFVAAWIAIAGFSGGLLTRIDLLDLTFLQYAATIAKLLAWYHANLFYPSSLVFMYSLPPLESRLIFWSMTLLGSLAILLAWGVRSRDKVIPFGLVWFASGFLPFLATAFTHFHTGLVIEPHWFYFSTIGFFLIMARLLMRMRPLINPALFSLLIVSIIFYFASFTKRALTFWESQERYAYYWLSVSPTNEIAVHTAIGESISKGQYGQALILAEKLLALPLYPKFMSQYVVGFILYKQGELEKARHAVEESVQQNPDFASARTLLGSIQMAQNEMTLAQTNFQRALEINPNSSDAKLNLVAIYYHEGRYMESMALLEEILTYQPHPDAYWLLGQILIAQNDYDAALKVLNEGASLPPYQFRFHVEMKRVQSLLDRNK